jgi:predicted transcriptional regulator of viral defense system
MAQRTTTSVLAELAEEQWGLFTRRQADASGLAWSTLARLARGGSAERVAHGVYRLRGAPPVDHLELRAAWLQLAPDVPVWERTPMQGVVSHRSAAALLGLGHLPADVHEFVLPSRRQSRRPDVRLHRATVSGPAVADREGLLVTGPARTAADLLAEREDPGAVAQVVADALRGGEDRPHAFAEAIGGYAQRFGLRRDDGVGMLAWLLERSDEPARDDWLREAAAAAATGEGA